jgi:hypothetical protein
MAEIDAGLRTALAAAIAEAAEREQAAERAKRALERALEALAASETELEGWFARGRRQAEEHAEQLRQWAVSPFGRPRPATPSLSLADVEAREAAEAVVATARAAKLGAAEDLRISERALATARREVEIASARILDARAIQLASELVAAERTAYELRERLASLARAYVTASSGNAGVPALSQAVETALREGPRRADHRKERVDAYREWLKRLLTDADAGMLDEDDVPSVR